MKEEQKREEGGQKSSYDPNTGLHWLEVKISNLLGLLLLVMTGVGILFYLVIQIMIWLK